MLLLGVGGRPSKKIRINSVRPFLNCAPTVSQVDRDPMTAQDRRFRC